MKISFLGQGYESSSINAVGNHLMNFLSSKAFDTFTGISAFASESGIFGLSEYIKSACDNFKSLNLIVGIDLGGTYKVLYFLPIRNKSFIIFVILMLLF